MQLKEQETKYGKPAEEKEFFLTKTKESNP